MADPYGINPLAEEMRERDPARYAQVSAVVEPPKMFAGGTADVPAFTASGIDPQLLLQLPVGIRHAAAAHPDIAKVHSWFEEYAEFPEVEVEHQGLRDAKLRVERWMRDTDLDTRTPEERIADADAEYAMYYDVAGDRATYALEQQRRARAGETPLEDFAELSARRAAAMTWAANMGRRG